VVPISINKDAPFGIRFATSRAMALFWEGKNCLRSM